MSSESVRTASIGVQLSDLALSDLRKICFIVVVVVVVVGLFVWSISTPYAFVLTNVMMERNERLSSRKKSSPKVSRRPIRKFLIIR